MESSRIGGRTHTRDVLLSTGNGRHVFLRSLLAPVTSNAGREGPQVWCVRGQPRGGRFQCCFGHRGDSGAPVAPGCTTSPRLGRRRHSAQPFGEHVSLRGSVTPYNKVPPGTHPPSPGWAVTQAVCARRNRQLRAATTTTTHGSQSGAGRRKHVTSRASRRCLLAFRIT